MALRRQNSQMFALPGRPDDVLDIDGAAYKLVRVFKHDFWAATCLYETDNPAVKFPKLVIKFGRSHPFIGLPLRWVGEMLADHEQAIYARLAGVAGVPSWGGRLSEICYAIEYVQAVPLDHLDKPPAGFFDKLREIFDAVHARGVAYGDANKKSNILVTQAGLPVLIDYQISLRTRDDLPWPFRQIARRCVNYLIGKDIYHLYKHKRRLAKDELTPEEEELSRSRSGLHLLHRKLTKPYRSLRRGFLKKQFEKGQLLSPSADLEDHHQPEKETWRKE